MTGSEDASAAADDGRDRFEMLLGMLPAEDPRRDIDTASLVGRFPHLSDVRIRDVEFAGSDGAVCGRVYTGPTASGSGLVWVHGGAFISGSLDMPESHWVGMELAARGIPVLALDYRKALAGVSHPALSDDVLTGWRAAATDEGLLGVAARDLHLGGASAGANLVAGVAVRERDAGGALPASLLLFYPVLHDRVPAPGPAAREAAIAVPPELRFSPQFIRAVTENYVGASGSTADPVAFPAHARLDGLPPTLIVNAEADDLRPSGEEFGSLLADAGVSAETIFEPGTVHGYLDHPGLPEAVASIGRIAARIMGSSPADGSSRG
ncbi:alpha/beta hydrolase [Labedella populi]|uniref:alpha/beta hydrolase n=1 Tax=Labedella populi TaxID=2498850 RepID=UPI00140DE82B|nr:alpha/beta hydrolase fold domain-containing protein [Labedella populi]